MNEVEDIGRQFGIDGRLHFEALGEGLVQAVVATPQAEARLCLQGAHMLAWQPRHQVHDVLWLSAQARYLPGKSIRGGVPVCWPWFGPHPQDASLPAHGFARSASWQVTASRVTDDGAVALTLQLAGSHAAWPHATELSLTIEVGQTLRMALTTRNTGTQAIPLGEALHTYFKVSDIGTVSVIGLDGVAYWDTVGTVTRKVQAGAIDFAAETDRVYIDSPQRCVIEDPGLARRIHIEKQGSLSTVVWSPWTDKAARMGDLGQPDGWRGMLCVESGNAWDNCLNLAPGASHTLDVRYRVENIE